MLSVRSIVTLILWLILFGYFVPAQLGWSFMDSRVIFAYAALPLLGGANAAAQGIPAGVAIAGGRLLAVTLGVWVAQPLTLAAALLTVNLQGGSPRMVLPDGWLLAATLAFGWAGASVAVFGSLWMVRRANWSANAPRLALRVVVVLLIGIALLSGKMLGGDAMARLTTTEGLTRLAFAGAAVLTLASLALWRKLFAGALAAR